MIFLVSNTIDASNIDGVKKLTVDESLDIIAHWPVVQFDTETTGLDARVCSLVSMQFGYKHFDTGDNTQIVVDCLSVDPVEYKEVIEMSYLIGHNLKFDLKFLYNYGIVPLNVYDTMICEQTLYLGYSKKQITYTLHDVLLRYTGIDLDKSYQKEIADSGLTREGIIYAAGDVVHLQDIRKAQVTIAKSRNCEKAFTVENQFVPAVAYLEWCGIHLDEDKWRVKMTHDVEELQSYRDWLDNFVISDERLNKDFVTTTSTNIADKDNDAALFTFEPACTIDWDSPKQVAPVFKKLGFDTTVFDKENEEEKDTVVEKILSLQKGIADDFMDAYFGYKGAAKAVSSYGQGHLNQINPETGRIHTEFRQIGTVTGRMASGSTKSNKDLAKKKKLRADLVTYCNMQNLPARGDAGKITRSCFTAAEGNVFVSCDYSAEESRVQADVWNEKSLLDSFKNGIDTHNLYAKMCFPEELKDIDVKDVKKERPDLRQAAKSAEFAVGYGSDGSSIATAVGMSKEKAREMVQGILKGMPGMANFKKKTSKFLKEHGYIVINETTGHRVYWPEWASWKAVEDTFDRFFWDDYKANHKGTGDAVCKKVREHMSKGHDWFGKNVLNYPIQGGSAIVLKQAAGDLFRWVVNNGYFGKILFCVFVHDEIDCECPKELSDMFSNKMQEIMERAAARYYKRLPIPAEASCGDHWIH